MKDDQIETIAWRNSFKGFTKELENYPNNLQNIHTPFDLCNSIIGKLKESVVFEDKTFCTINLEFVETLMYNWGVSGEKIWFVTDCKEKAAIAKCERYGVHVVICDFLKWEPNMKFDVMIMNPPYQIKSNKENRKTQSIWPLFVIKSIELTKENGYVCNIHPSSWRDPDGMFKNVQKTLCQKQMLYLEMHDIGDGLKTFGAKTSYDTYCLKNTKNTKNTTIRFLDGAERNVDISELEFIPNSNFDLIMKLVAKKGEEKVVLIGDSTYHTQARMEDGTMSKTKVGVFKHPCVYTTTKDGKINLWWSSVKRNHFGTPKVIWSNGYATTPFVDKKGEFGLTQFAFAISENKNNLELVKKALENKLFLKLMRTNEDGCSHKYNRKVISTFRKNFWMEFL